MRTSLSFSVRRHFVDRFFVTHSYLLRPGSAAIDIGGRKFEKRGLFDITETEAIVTYVNINPATKPDIIADAGNIPVADESYDVAVMGELLEHVPDPLAVLREAYRILRPGGTVLLTVPFLYPIHADPFDFGRYTESYWKRAAVETGFSGIAVEYQGTLFAVIALALQHFFMSPPATYIGKVAKSIVRRLFRIPIINLLMWFDGRTRAPLLRCWTTGFGVILTK